MLSKVDIAMISFLVGAAVSGSIILLTTKDRIQESQMQSYNAQQKAKILTARANKILSEKRNNFLRKEGLI